MINIQKRFMQNFNKIGSHVTVKFKKDKLVRLEHNCIKICDLNDGYSIAVNATKAKEVYIKDRGFKTLPHSSLDSLDNKYEIVDKTLEYVKFMDQNILTKKSRLFFFKIKNDTLLEKAKFNINYEMGLNNADNLNKFIINERKRFIDWCIVSLVKNNFLYLPTQDKNFTDSDYVVINYKDFKDSEIDKTFEGEIYRQIIEINDSPVKNKIVDNLDKKIHGNSGICNEIKSFEFKEWS